MARSVFGTLPGVSQKADEVTVKNLLDIVGGIASIGQKPSYRLKVGDGIEIFRDLLSTEAAVEITPDPTVVRIACDLADVVYVIEDMGDFETDVCG
jgi:hypothetical protein